MTGIDDPHGWGGIRVHGWTARSLRNLTIAMGVWTIVEIGVGLWMLFAGFTAGVIALLALMFIEYVWPNPLKRREAEEIRAGYTTLSKVHLHVAQRDPRTGAVIREAGGTTTSTPSAQHDRESRRERHPMRLNRRSLRSLGTAVLVLGGVATLIYAVVTFSNMSASGALTIVAIVGLVAAVCGGVVAFVMRHVRRRSTMLFEFTRTRRQAGEHTELVLGGDELGDALQILNTNGDRRVQTTMGIAALVITEESLALWGATATEVECLASFPLTEVQSIAAPDTEAVRVTLEHSGIVGAIDLVPVLEYAYGAKIAGGTAPRKLWNTLAMVT
ncbi:hypothetical protein KXS11_10445 [Plantibacter flavus]|uniref:hypothetical protein n=1 Tax=Plantibacter flavus TaxID=150123 RepID=UPI003F17D326